MTSKVSGIVEAVGDKFNGSLKINGKWISNKKGFKNPAKQGDHVTLTLTPWEFQDKKGESITAVDFLVDSTVVIPRLPEPKKEQIIMKPGLVQFPVSVGRDFDSENRGKVRHGLTVALVPLLATDTITLEKAKEVVTSLVEFVMKG